MKVCFVTTSFVRSANDHYARFVYEQAKSLRTAEADTEVVVVVPHAPGLAMNEDIGGHEIRRAPYFWPFSLQLNSYRYEGWLETFAVSPLAALQGPMLLLALLFRLWGASRGAQVIHAQWLPSAAIAALVGWLRGIPVVVSVRGVDVNSARKSRLLRAVTRTILRRAAHIVPVSDEFRDALRHEFGCKRPMTALYNGVDTEQFHPRDKLACRRTLGLPEDQKMILFVGSMIKRKGIDTLLKALSHHAVADRSVQLVLAGEGPRMDEMKALAAAEGLADRVRFLGKVGRDEVHLWMSAADMLVLPSHSEGRPNVVLEGMASGLPVVATGVNGTVELISDGKDGLLFEPGDVAGLAARLDRVLRQPELARDLAGRAVEKIRELGLTWIEHGRRLTSIYRDVIEGARVHELATRRRTQRRGLEGRLQPQELPQEPRRAA